MTGAGKIIRRPNRQLRLVLAMLMAWLVLVCLLGAWWGSLVLKQAARIAELEQNASAWVRTQRMVYWESASYFALLIGCTAVLFWLYWRDMKRARSLHAFFASVTHELRTPLTSIRLQAESIAEGLEGDVAQRSLVARLIEDTMRLEGQVERTLELARVEGGGPVFTQPVRLKPWLERMVRSWQEAYGGRVSFVLECQDLAVEADPSVLQIILRNLLENSFRHGRRERLEISIRAEAKDGGVFLAFKDNGDGFKGDPRYLGKIFEKGPTSQGAGVGLYLIDALMRRMGGSAAFAARSGFEVSLRFQEAKAHG